MDIVQGLIKAKQFRRMVFLGGCLLWVFLVAGTVQADPLSIKILAKVDDQGRVKIMLSLKNNSRKTLHHIHPMFHFHHTMSHMQMVHSLEPGESIELRNDQHPPVVRVGSYPLVAMVNYKEEAESPDTFTQVHTDSFNFKEPLSASIEGEINTEVKEERSIVKVLLKNTSPALKNIRMMLLLPPELVAESFQGMMGFTLRGGEEKYFEVPVTKVAGRPGGTFPVHLMVEYGEMLKHYVRDIPGQINFGPVIGRASLWPQMLAFVFVLGTFLLWVRYRLKYRRASIPPA